MIRKISKINNFAVFDNYRWDAETINKDGQPLQFEKINILYGRNYSGKTTLSRIMRALETKQLPDKYDCPTFELIDESDNAIDQDDLISFSTPVRVFNEDFVRENLTFLIDPAGEIAPFAILGGDNSILEKQISELSNEIGVDGENKTGIHKLLEDAETQLASSDAEYRRAVSELESLLSKKATDRKIGIKYKSDKFGDVNYNITKLKNDIRTIEEPSYQTPTDEEIAECEARLKDTVQAPIPQLNYTPKYQVFRKDTLLLLSKEIGNTNRIQRLLHDTALNLWVKRGVELADNAKECPFCGNPIGDDFWVEIHAHFDEESKELENSITNLISKIEREINNDFFDALVSPERFYSEYVRRYETDRKSLLEEKSKYKDALQNLIDSLQQRLLNIATPIDPLFQDYDESRVVELCLRLNTTISENNNYSGKINSAKEKAYKVLRLKEVEDYCATIGYADIIQKNSKLETAKEQCKTFRDEVKNKLLGKQAELEAKKRLLHDEEKGALHVNEYLNDFFGHRFVTLEAKKDSENDKLVKFQIMRKGKPAYNLSEGECSLIAFCYFMAKLDDTSTSGTKPIIWIDDPISSLDSNHIYFVFSLIVSKIAKVGCFDQLFLSTHNLDFLKYLHRIKSYKMDSSGNQKEVGKAYYLIERIGATSAIKALPNYLKKNATEYNYLFSQIYKVAQCISVTDENYDMLYSFGNSARKFLEVYLYFKYPTDEDLLPKLKRFFAPEDIPPILINRLVNEDSHGPTPENGLRLGIDPETIPVAQKILQLLGKDEEQYEAFEKSII